jgi:diguanylate cyclase (GGDEF)-like protein
MTAEGGKESAQVPELQEERHLLLLGVVLCAIVMFVGTGSAALLQSFEGAVRTNGSSHSLVTTALLLNIALIMLGWRRHRRLTAELTASRQEAEEARKAANSDALTGCYNRRFLAHWLEQGLASGKAAKVNAAILLDLDDFKQVNDANGHRVGDIVLATAARRIQALLPSDAMLARLGGDEFVCLVPSAHNQRRNIDHLAAAIVSSLSSPFEVDKFKFEISVSAGIATDEQRETPFEDVPLIDWLIHRADIAMYHAKRKGKNRYYWFDRSMETELVVRSELERDIRAGIERGEFVPFYEQQVDLITREIVGFEMLARWNSPKHGLVLPELFVPIAEALNLIGSLSELLLRKAFEDARGWPGHLVLSVNISPVQLRDPWFAQRLIKLMLEHGFPPQRLEIEITESALHHDIGNVRAMISSLRNQGVSVSLDDFGTGYSSLSQLRELPFDRIKIDRSFVARLGRQNGDVAVVDAIMELSERLGLPVTIEGVETEGILEALGQRPGVKAQGYHFGRPESGEAVAARFGNANGPAVEHPVAKASRAAAGTRSASVEALPSVDRGSPSLAG